MKDNKAEKVSNIEVNTKSQYQKKQHREEQYRKSRILEVSAR